MNCGNSEILNFWRTVEHSNKFCQIENLVNFTSWLSVNWQQFDISERVRMRNENLKTMSQEWRKETFALVLQYETAR